MKTKIRKTYNYLLRFVIIIATYYFVYMEIFYKKDLADVFDFINSGNITGVFQWDTHNYKQVISQLKPYSFKELVDFSQFFKVPTYFFGLVER